MSNILVVDDNKDIRDLLTFYLEMEDYNMKQASSGKEALLLVNDEIPDVIILDLMMPLMDGIEVCKSIRKNTLSSYSYIIMLSARGEVTDKVNGLDNGADSYITKPFSPEEIKAQVRVGLKTAEQRSIAMYDKLTGLLNRRLFEKMINKELSIFERNKQIFCLVFLDLDHFKDINDTYGHDVGDNVLSSVGNLISDFCRPNDLAFRWGGEEFVLILTLTDIDDALLVSNRLKDKIASYKFKDDINMTASFGITAVEDGDNSQSICKRADVALYQAKTTGRNKVEIN